MLTSLRNTWKSLTLPQRLTLGGVLALVFVGLLAAAQVSGRKSYGVLFADLAPEDAGAVVEKLRELKAEYRLAQGGRAIEVPEERVYDLRLALATEGLPQGGAVGFELFDKSQFGATDFTQRLNYQRALQGELTRTISRLEGVVEARVHLAIPEARLFTEKEQPTTASVVLRLRPGYRLDQRRVAGILHLVSSAVEGLSPENVTIHDAQGELLTSGAGSSAFSGNYLQLQGEYERHLEQQLRRLADQVLGTGKAAVRVGAEFNWEQTETTSETYRPSGPGGANLPVEVQTNVETYGRDGARVGTGIAGVASNLRQPLAGGRVWDGGPEEAGRYSNRQSTSRYVVNKVVQRRITPPGRVRRISVAVLLDGRISRAQQAALREAFAAAAALDLTPANQGGRGDQIQLVPMAFDRAGEMAAAREAAQAAQHSYRLALIRNGAAVLIVMLCVVTSLIWLSRLRAARTETLDVLLGEPSSLSGGEAEAPPKAAAGRSRSLGPAADGSAAARGDAALDWDIAATPVLAERIRRLAQERPADVARYLQLWMGHAPSSPSPSHEERPLVSGRSG